MLKVGKLLLHYELEFGPQMTLQSSPALDRTTGRV